jgi:hypothetical protein
VLRQARKLVLAVDVHRTRAADPFSARAPECQRRVDLVLDLDQRVEDHRRAVVHVDVVRIETRVLAGVRVVAIDRELLDVRRAVGPAVVLARLDLRVGWKRELRHRPSLVFSTFSPSAE